MWNLIGLMALPRTPLIEPTEESEPKDAVDVVDATTLPPG